MATPSQAAMHNGQRRTASRRKKRRTAAPARVIQIVQSVMVNPSLAGAGSSTLTLNNVAAGNALVLVVGHGQATTNSNPTVTGMTATLDVTSATSALTDTSQYPSRVRIYHQFNVTAGNKSVQVAFSGETYGHAVLMEVKGISALDKTFANGQGLNGTGTAPTSGPIASPSDLPALLVTGLLQCSSSGTGAHVFGTPAGHTLVAKKETGMAGMTTVKMLNAAGQETVTWVSNKDDAYATALAIFK